jgi:hypothetical protein
VLAHMLPETVNRGKPTSIVAGIYGFIANIYLYAIDTRSSNS